MILTAHIITGAAVGVNFSNPWLVVLLSVICHHLADLLPHWDYGINVIGSLGQNEKKIFILPSLPIIKEIPLRKSFLKISSDISIGFVLVAGTLIIFHGWEIPRNFSALFSGLNLNLMLGIFFSLLPDGLLLLSWFFPKKPLVYYAALHSKLHTSFKLNSKQGILPLLIYLLVIILLI